MKTKSILMTAVLVGLVMAVYSFASPVSSGSILQEPDSGFSYAVLTIQGEDRVTWDEGGSDLPRTRPLDAIYRELGGKQRATVVNLLNAIGEQEWQLVEINESSWTFIRRN